jgi:MurNAc alpha-1-phosphate uridylyltransferase
MVLAAGFGERMRPITERIPKPLVPVAGRTLLDRALDRLEAAGVETVVVNTHHLAPVLERHLAARPRPRTVLSHEPLLLETGGGVANALPLLGPGPFYVINGDALWLDGEGDSLVRLADAWDESRMAALLLVVPTARAVGYDGAGDFNRAPDGRLRRRATGEQAPYLYIGVQLLSARLFDGVAVEKFSLNKLWDRAIAAGRLYGMVHDGAYCHIATPENVAVAERALAAGAAARVPRGTAG